MTKFSKDRIKAHQVLIDGLLNNDKFLIELEHFANSIINVFNAGGKVLLCGNGGSAADAAHLAAEFSGRFYLNRPPLDAEALHVNDSFLTAVANDFGYKHIFERAIQAKGKAGDLLIVLSTSGRSENVIKAIEMAVSMNIKTACFTGEHGEALAGMCHFKFIIPSTDTPRIQETYMLLGHIICEWVEMKMFGDEKTGI
jgi:D-sedoheptulose 7-phosphate isomerase